MSTIVRVFLVVALSVASAVAQTAPKISLKETTWKFGKIDQGEMLTHTIEVRNLGDAPLQIKKVGVSCGCVSGTIKSKEIAPGQSDSLEIKLDSSRVMGDIRKEVFVETNDANSPKIEVFVEGRIECAWDLSTTNLNFGDVRIGAEGKVEFKIIVTKDRPITVKDIRTSTPRIVIEKTPFEYPDKTHGFNCTAKLAKDTPIGNLYGSIEVVTDFAAMNVRTINVQARVVGNVVVAPDRLVFGQVVHGDSKTMTFRVEKLNGEGLAIDRVTCTDPAITTKIVEKEKARIFEIEVKYTPGTPRFNNGRLSIFTNEPDQKILFVTFTGSTIPK